MILQERDYRVLLMLARHLLLSGASIQPRCYPNDKTKRVTRRRLLKMTKAGYIKRRTLQSASAPGGPLYVYQLDQKGKESLALKSGSNRYLRKPTSLRQPMHLRHYLGLADVSLMFEDAIKSSPDVNFRAWYNEEEFLGDSDDNKTLFTLVQKRPKVICAPDAAFVIEFNNCKRVCYIEYERGTTGAKGVAKKKATGFHLFHQHQFHKKHFPSVGADCFDVLCIAQNRIHRDKLKRAFKDAPGKNLWLFADKHDLAADTFFFGPVWHDVTNSKPIPLISKSLTLEVSADETVKVSV